VTPSVGQLLAEAGLPLAEARALLAQSLGVSRERLIAFPEVDVEPAAAQAFSSLAARRRAGEPLAYLRGVQEFYGRAFRVTPDVLVPRPDTETLIERALDCLRGLSSPRVLDLGCGSGCIAVTLKLERPDASVTATDLSAAALAVATGNAAALGAHIEFRQGDWYAALGAAEAFDLIASNPPYIAAGDEHLPALRHEPARALTDGGDGLRHLTRLIDGARRHLRSGGWLLLEHGFDQADAVAARLQGAGFREIEAVRDSGGHRRVACARA
jgi:release factor glutamine methyltransferase